MKIHHLDEALCLATSGNLFINAWDGPVTVARLRKIGDVEVAFAKQAPDGICVLSIIHKPGNMMSLSSEERAVADEVTRAVTPFVKARAFVVVGSGFWVATARTVIAGVNLAVRSPYPTRTFSSVDESAPFLASIVKELDGGTVSAQRIVSEAQRVLSEFTRSRPRATV